MVAHLLNIDDSLAKLGFQTMPKAADAAMPTRQDLAPSPDLSIVERARSGSRAESLASS